MTTFALVQRETTRRKPVKLNALTAVRVNKNMEEELIEKQGISQQNRRAGENAIHSFYGGNGDIKKTRFTSQIGIIYLKPVVGYSTSVYFHSKEDLSEEHKPAGNSRYEQVSTFVFVDLTYTLRYFFLVNSCRFDLI